MNHLDQTGSTGIDGEDNPTIVQSEERDDVDKLQQLLKELDMAGGVARVFRQRPGQSEHDYEGEIPIDGFSLEMVKRVYGGGRYMIRFAAKGGRFVRTIKFSISPHHKGEIDIARESTLQQVASAVAPSQSDSGGNAMLQFMQQQSQMQERSSRETMMFMMTMLTETQKSTTQIIAAALGRPVAPVAPESGNRVIELMTPFLLESLKPRGNTSEVIEQIKLVKELVGTQSPQEEKDDMLTRLITVGAPLAAAFMNRNAPPMAAQPPPPPPQRTPQPGVLAAPPAQDDQTRAEAKMKDLLSKLSMVTPILVRAAANDSSIESYLEILDDSLDDESYGMLLWFLEREDWVVTLFQNNPGVVKHLPWFNNMRQMILNDAREEDPGSEGSTPGDAQGTASPATPAG